MFIMRKLTENDFDDIKEISKNIWDGTDYLPKVFHEWVYDKGYFLGAIDTETNKVIAVGKLSYLNDGSGWLEGLRVHINYRGKKIGKLITEELITLAKEALQRKEISKIAFATHSSNIESLTMMQKKDFKIRREEIIVSKDLKNISSSCNLNNFQVKPWNCTFSEFKDMEYIKRRENFLPLAFTFEEPTEGLYEKLLKDNCFVNINGYNGIIKIKGEPNFISAEESYTAIDTFMNFCLLKYTSKGYPSPMTSVLPEDFDLIEKLKANNYDSWNDCKPDYYYLVL